MTGPAYRALKVSPRILVCYIARGKAFFRFVCSLHCLYSSFIDYLFLCLDDLLLFFLLPTSSLHSSSVYFIFFFSDLTSSLLTFTPYLSLTSSISFLMEGFLYPSSSSNPKSKTVFCVINLTSSVFPFFRWCFIL